jgi:conjugative transfer signal peptidase TraF
MRTKGVVAAMVIAGFLILATCFVRVNHSPSMPRGLWIETGLHVLSRGDIVVVCLEKLEQVERYVGVGYCPGRLEPVLKYVAAVPGDTVTFDDQGIAVNGVHQPNSKPMARDGVGRPLQPAGGYPYAPLSSGFVWLLTQRADSYDSRYFGAVPVSRIRGTAAPLLVWK